MILLKDRLSMKTRIKTLRCCWFVILNIFPHSTLLLPLEVVYTSTACWQRMWLRTGKPRMTRMCCTPWSYPMGMCMYLKGCLFTAVAIWDLELCPKYSFSGSSWIAFCTGSILNNKHLGNMCSHLYEMHLLKSNTCLWLKHIHVVSWKSWYLF